LGWCIHTFGAEKGKYIFLKIISAILRPWKKVIKLIYVIAFGNGPKINGIAIYSRFLD